MKLALKWHKPLTLRADKHGVLIYTVPLTGIPTKPGIYIFLRTHGSSSEALYVGRADNLHSRIKQHLNNLKLMRGIEKASTGKRLLVFAEFVPKTGQQQNRALRLLETAFIRHYLSYGHQLLNVQGTKIAKDSIASERSDLKKFIPKELYFES
jgi:predicted GIY-YIG superfamily endonuclease